MTAFDILFCSAIVAVYAVSRFNALQDQEYPPPSRSTTTAVRYHIAQTVYIMFSLALLFGLASTPRALAALSLDDVQLPAEIREMPPHYVSALLLTVLLPRIPLLGQIDAWIRAQIYDLAAIPSEAARLKAELRGAEFTVPVGVREDVQRRLGPIARELGEPLPPRAPKARLVRSVAILEKLNQVEHQPGFAAFLSRNRPELTSITTRLDELIGDARHVQEMESLAVGESGDVSSAAERAARDFGDSVERRSVGIYNQLCRYVSRAILFSQATESRRRRAIQEFGFTPRPSPPLTFAAAVNCIGMIVVTVWLLLLVTFIIMVETMPDQNQGFLEISLKVLMIGFVYAAAIFWPYLLVPFRREKLSEGAALDWSKIIPAVFLAVVTELCIRLGFKYLIALGVMTLPEGGSYFDAALADLRSTLPWSLVTISTAIACGVLFNVPPPEPGEARRRRWLEAGIVAGGNGIAAVLICLALGRESPPIVAVAPMMTIIGGVIGLTIPTARRAQMDRRVVTVVVEDEDDPRAAPSVGGGVARG